MILGIWYQLVLIAIFQGTFQATLHFQSIIRGTGDEVYNFGPYIWIVFAGI